MTNAWANPDSSFACGGSIETEVWQTWDENMHYFLMQQQLKKRLVQQADVYALYDVQTYTHNLVSMARRCNRTKRLTEISILIQTAYAELEPGTTSSPGRRWVCRGGSICNDKNRLLNKEVILDSAQFLGLASSIANALALSNTPISNDERTFIENTIQITSEHLLRWGNDNAINSIFKKAEAEISDVKNGSSELFFTDYPLWLITIYAEIAGIIQNKDRRQLSNIALSDENKARMHMHLSALLRFFNARIYIYRNQDSTYGNLNLADLDRGYWRFYADNSYAGYEKEEKPIVCRFPDKDKSKYKIEVNVSANTVPQRQDTGWDISHARRLVHALDALERNRNALKSIFSLDEDQLPIVGLTTAFANTLVAVMWNRDMAYPLFSNYWCGANGWYRVGYDNGTRTCREGYPPFGLTNSFVTGGYITWARFKPVIGLLGQRLYDLISSPDVADSSFINKYYPGLGKSVNSQVPSLARFMFLPSLVGVTEE